MTASSRSTMRLSSALDRTGQWVFAQDIPSDVVIDVCGVTFSLHKFMLLAKSNYIRKLLLESREPDLSRITLLEIPGGPETFEKAAKFCYGINFEITVHNVAGIRCAAEFLQMTESLCDNNLATRTDDFLSQVALSSLPGAVAVLKSCQTLLPMAEDIKIVQKSLDVVSFRCCNEANFPTKSPPNWWAEELAVVDTKFLGGIIASMKKRGAKPLAVATLLIKYTERNLSSEDKSLSSISAQRELVEFVTSQLPAEKSSFPTSYLCCLLRSAILFKTSSSCRSELEKRISVVLDKVTADDLISLSSLDGDSLSLDSVRKIISGFVEKEKTMSVFGGTGGFRETISPAMERVAKMVDVYVAEIATCERLSIPRFNGIATLIPKSARKVDDDVYRAVDIYLKSHPSLEEIEREKVCSVMDPLRLSYEARLHASQNKRLPVQIVLHALYYDQLRNRSGDPDADDRSVGAKSHQESDASLIRENEALRAEVMKMKMYISEIQQRPGGGPSNSRPCKTSLLSVVSKTLGKLNPFKNGTKDTSNISENKKAAKPKKRRFSIS